MTLPVYTGTLTPAHCQLITGIRDAPAPATPQCIGQLTA
jgi:hypothetical protein